MTIANNVAAQIEINKKLIADSNAFYNLHNPKKRVSAPSPPRPRSSPPSPSPSPTPSRPTTPTRPSLSGAAVSIGNVHGGRTRSRRRNRRTTKKSKNKKSRK